MKMSRGATDVVAERLRQVTKEGYDDAHDDRHTDGAIALAAATYATPIPLFRQRVNTRSVSFVDPWPWEEKFDKRPYSLTREVRHPSTYDAMKRRDLLVKAGALVIAEIDRLDRLFGRASTPQRTPPRHPRALQHTRKTRARVRA